MGSCTFFGSHKGEILLITCFTFMILTKLWKEGQNLLSFFCFPFIYPSSDRRKPIHTFNKGFQVEKTIQLVPNQKSGNEKKTCSWPKVTAIKRLKFDKGKKVQSRTTEATGERHGGSFHISCRRCCLWLCLLRLFSHYRADNDPKSK